MSNQHTATKKTCRHVESGQVCRFEAQHQAWDRRDVKIEEESGMELFYLNDEKAMLEAEIAYGLFCPICDHGNGCQHGVPMARW